MTDSSEYSRAGSSPSIKFPDVVAPMVGEDGNVFAVISRVSRALALAGHGDDARTFVRAAMACTSYNEVLALVMDWVDVT
jgi:hypothetical protein